MQLVKLIFIDGPLSNMVSFKAKWNIKTIQVDSTNRGPSD